GGERGGGTGLPEALGGHGDQRPHGDGRPRSGPGRGPLGAAPGSHRRRPGPPAGPSVQVPARPGEGRAARGGTLCPGLSKWLEVDLPASQTDSFVSWLLSFGPDARVYSPRAIRDQVVARLEALAPCLRPAPTGPTGHPTGCAVCWWSFPTWSAIPACRCRRS